ncbi:MAG: nucleotide exchange factor GrpE [Nevskiaceae bacterium]|jgi:molecular chaperone GrpE|nr:nucleotide exchange factor GrpE [Nevskiaceae bacterium]
MEKTEEQSLRPDPDDLSQTDAGAELERLREALVATDAQAREQALRAAAEMENLRKRTEREIQQAHRFALEKFAQELLPVADSLELAVANAGKADAASLAAGQEAVLKLLARAFDRFAIRVLNPLGEPFDPQLHEAMAMIEAPHAEPDSVVEVVQRGYELNGRLLRPARVIVARASGGA